MEKVNKSFIGILKWQTNWDEKLLQKWHLKWDWGSIWNHYAICVCVSNNVASHPLIMNTTSYIPVQCMGKC